MRRTAPGQVRESGFSLILFALAGCYKCVRSCNSRRTKKMGEVARLVATLAAGLWAGAAGYISLVEHPATVRVGVQFATDYFRPMARRAAPTMIALAVIGAVAGLLAWADGGSLLWLIGGAILAAMLPLTAIFIVPTNRRLLAVNAVESSTEATALLTRWGKLHAVRTVLGLVPFVLFVWALLVAS